MTRPSSITLGRRTLLRASLALPMAGLLAACGGSPAPSPTLPALAVTAQPIATAVTATTAPATATPVQGQPTPPATIPSQGQPTPPPTTPASQAPSSTPTAAAGTGATATTRLNLNTATREQFLTIPGVGDRMVREFLEYRPYRSIQQFRREIGKYVSQEQVAAYEQYVFVPVDPNGADTDTLRQLPGVDAAIAAQLIAGRPYASADAFLTRLGQYLSADQVAAARLYLATA